MNILKSIKNYVWPTNVPGINGKISAKTTTHNLNNYMIPVQLQRLRTDVAAWRDAVNEAELAWYPHRVKMQRMFMDTILNGHVASCIERRKDLTLLRAFMFCDGQGIEDEQWTKFFATKWFSDFINYTLDALFFGYSLIALGDMINDAFPEINIVKRYHVSPDRLNVTPYIYSTTGAPFLQSPYKMWHVWVPTVTEVGVSNCGYGLLYKIALYEIFLRNLLGFNGDFVELYSQPYRVGKTSKTNESERAELEQALRQMGSSGYALIDPSDEIEFLETALGGTGYTGYESLEKRCEEKISKLILGHADALDSTPGKLGGTQGDNSAAAQALKDKQVKDGLFVMNIINTELLPRLRQIGIAIPETLRFEYKNDAEVEECRRLEDQSNLAVAQIAATMKDAGLQMDAAYFAERTKIPTRSL